MAQPTQKPIEITELIRRSEAARAQLGASHAALKRKLDVPARIRDSVVAEPTKWVGGSLAVGFMAKFLFRKKKPDSTKRIKKVKKQRNFFLGLLALGMTVAKPVARIYATKLIKDYFRNRLEAGIANRPKRATARSPY